MSSGHRRLLISENLFAMRRLGRPAPTPIRFNHSAVGGGADRAPGPVPQHQAGATVPGLITFASPGLARRMQSRAGTPSKATAIRRTAVTLDPQDGLKLFPERPRHRDRALLLKNFFSIISRYFGSCLVGSPLKGSPDSCI